MMAIRPKAFLVGAAFLSCLASSASAADAWVQEAESRLASTRTYPRSAQVRKEAGTALIALQVDGNGLISAYRVAQSSGSDILDREAERALDRIGQFSPPPDRKPRAVTVRITWPGPQDKLID
ncbi:energy transducer TonB [Pedomonas mirosovicensis]|uniref:energy transducer TonB n=1 Tax=Pedomonas mirosovicensis TaxID=2908641 RepID=UPI0021681B81|nr:energy transducer TonB [Pedomonas mirosovicensis]MCH8684164.1 energy transducer TonB [Pedomonas mirosovicensis]